MNLYIIGNGFDRHHDINCRYSDFHDWLKENRCWYYEEIEDRFDCIDLWSDLERNMGTFNFQDYARSIAEDNPPNVASDHFEQSLSDARCEVENNLTEWRNEMCKGLSEWVSVLKAPNGKKQIKLKLDNALFLTFNYTTTLEDLYLVEESRIIHIHGKKGDDVEDLQLGHGGLIQKGQRNYSRDEWERDPNLVLAEEDAANMAESLASQWQKPVDANIAKLDRFWNALSKVTNVFVFGFSFAEVDMPYIRKVINAVPKTAKWAISYYGDEDYYSFQRIMNNEGVSNITMLKLADLQCSKSENYD